MAMFALLPSVLQRLKHEGKHDGRHDGAHEKHHVGARLPEEDVIGSQVFRYISPNITSVDTAIIAPKRR